MGQCIVDDCSSRSGRNSNEISFFRFPKRVEMKLKWVKSIRKKDWAPSKSSTICSLHFEEKFIIINKNGIRNLAKNAVPTLNLPRVFSSDIGTQMPEELIISSDTDEPRFLSSPCSTFESSRSSSSQSFFSDIGTDNEMVVSSSDVSKKLKLAVKRLTFISEKRKKTIKRLQQNKRRSKQKIETLTNILNKLNEEKLINNDEKTMSYFEDNLAMSE